MWEGEHFNKGVNNKGVNFFENLNTGYRQAETTFGLITKHGSKGNREYFAYFSKVISYQNMYESTMNQEELKGSE